MATAPSPPILIWSPGGGVPVGPVSNPPVYSQKGITQLVNGQSYVDVVFGSIQTTADWVLVECEVVNTTDVAPLNISTGIMTIKLTTGFRLYLNGMPDSNNYYLHWAVSGVNIVPVQASLYFLTGPTSGANGVAATFTVALPPSTTLSAPVVVSPSDGGSGGSFSPTFVTLTTGSPSQIFTYTPTSYGVRTINVTNSGPLVNPAGIAFNCVVTTYTFTGPTSGSTGSPSTNFTVALPVGGVVTGTVTVTPHDAGDGGTFTPSTVGLTTGAPSATFTYTPLTDGTKTISVTNNGGLTDPGNISYVASTPFSPSSIAGLKMWLKADSLALSDGDPVPAWNDSSSNAYNLTGTGTQRPTYKSAIVNSKPIVRFNGTTNILANGSDISVSQPNTVFFVAKQTAFPAITYVIFTNTPYIVGFPAAGHFIAAAGTALEDSTDWHAGFHVFTCKISGGTGTLYVDQAQTATGAIGALTIGTIAVGGYFSGGQWFASDVAEILIYNSALGNTDRVNVEAYLKAKYNTP